MPVIKTKGAMSSQGLGEFSQQGGGATYIEDVFSTWLYTGNGSTQTITNGIDLSTKGGLVWLKRRDAAAFHWLVDTARGNTKGVYTNSNGGEQTSNSGTDVTGFISSGFSLGTNFQVDINTNNGTYASWTFRKQSKFFDVVTYTGNGANRTIAHNLGSVPGCIIVKRTDITGNWAVYHRSLANTDYLVLNTTAASATGATYWNSTTATSTVFSLGTATDVNANGGTYVAYLFAHNAGGFGLTGTDNVISCGSYTTNGSDQIINLGYEAQFVIEKNITSANNWYMYDSMRGLSVTNTSFLDPDSSSSEGSGAASNYISPSAQGYISGASNYPSGKTIIYIAIRRGPMKTPTSGTSVFAPVTETSNTNPTIVTTGFPTDLLLTRIKNATRDTFAIDRLRGTSSNSYFYSLYTNTTGAEVTGFNGWGFDSNTNIIDAYFNPTWGSSDIINWAFRRAPGFFDVVCYTGSSSGVTVNHNLGVPPELIIEKCRNFATDWNVYFNFGTTSYSAANLNKTVAASSFSYPSGVGAQPTSTQWIDTTRSTGETAVCYLFASCPGVSKVGSYTGTGTTKQIDCGFTGGARFVLIKRTDSTGDWYVWDSARGIVAGNDPYLLLNSTAAEVTNTDYVDTYSAGFEISSTAPAAINANGGSFIFLAIA